VKKEYCSYYQAGLVVEKTWFVVGALRNEDHLAFERALENQTDILEFFVPVSQEACFVDLMQHFQSKGYITWLEKKTNRYAEIEQH